MNLTNAYEDLKSREEWTNLRPLSSPRWNGEVVALNENQAVIMGGCNNDWHVVKSVILYDKRTEETINWPSMTMRRREFGATLINNKIFAVGGLGETDINHHQIEVLDMHYLADGWQEINVDLPAGFCIEK